jgi:hypothetical protein
MKKWMVLGLSLSLVGCNCSDSNNAKRGGKAKASAATQLDALLKQLPAKDTAMALAIHDLPGAVAGLKAQVYRLATALDDPAKVHAALDKRFGFDIFSPEAWVKAGVDPKGGLAVWYGGTGEMKTWTAFVLLRVADKKALMERVAALAQREGAMDVGKPEAHDGGEWFPFQRTLGQKITSAGGVFVKGERAVLTSATKDKLALLKAGDARLDADALYKELRGQMPGLGQGVIFATKKAAQTQGVEANLLGLNSEAWLASFSAEPQRLSLTSRAKLNVLVQKQAKAMVPAPVAVTPVPADTLAALVQSTDPKAVVNTLSSLPQFAQALKQVETGLAGLNIDMQKDVLDHMGTTWSAWVGAGKNTTSLLTLMASAFVGVDVAGGNPQGFIDTAKKVVESGGAPLPGLTGLPNGFDFQHEMGKLEIRADAAAKRLTLRFGTVPQGKLSDTRPEAKTLNLDGETYSSVWLDFKGLSKAIKAGAVLAGSSPLGGLVGKAADALGQMDYLIVTGGMKGAYQTGFGELVMAAPTATP